MRNFLLLLLFLFTLMAVHSNVIASEKFWYYTGTYALISSSHEQVCSKLITDSEASGITATSSGGDISYCTYQWRGTSQTHYQPTRRESCNTSTQHGNPARDAICAPACPAPGTSAGSVTVTTAWATGPSTTSAIAQKVVQDGGWSGASFCDAGCLVRPAGNLTAANQSSTPSANGYYRVTATGPMEHVGSECTETLDNTPEAPGTEPSDPPPDTPGRCPRGTTQVGIESSGTPKCVAVSKPQSQDSSSATTKTTNPDGSTTETTTETTKNRDGSSTTKTTSTTTNGDGSKNSTTTVSTGNRPDGGEGKDDSSEGEKSDLCKKNPELTICTNSAVTTDCGKLSCDGDAIQCAIYRQQREAYCEAIKDTDERKLGNNMLKNTDPLKTKIEETMKGTEVDFSNQRFDQSGFLGGGACLADRSIQVAGRAIPVSFSTVCQNIIGLRAAIMACALIVAYMLVSRSVLQG